MIRCCTSLGPPEVWVSDTATLFKNALMAILAEALGVDHRFAVSYSAWITGTVEEYHKEAIRTAKAIPNESIRKTSEWAYWRCCQWYSGL